MQKYELIVFDWDGTLMDSEGRIVTCMQYAAADVGVMVPTRHAARDIIGLGLREAVCRLFPDADDATVDHVIEAYREHWLADAVPAAAMFAGADKLIHGLAEKGYLLAVATGKSRRGLEKSFDESGLRDYFHASRCADEAFSKPHPQMLEDLMSHLGCAPARTLMVGDTEYDMQMAANARTDALGVSFGVHEPKRLFAHGALACLDALAEIPDWIVQRTLNI